MNSYWHAAVRGALGLSVLASAMLAAHPVRAQDSSPEVMAQCALNVCKVVVNRPETGKDISCDLSKTWSKNEIAEKSAGKPMSWVLGNVHCAVKMDLERASIVSALKAKEYTLKAKPHAVKCEIGKEGSMDRVSLTLEPVITFKNGEVVKVSLGASNIKAPAAISSILWTAIQLEKLGVFDKDMLREVNKFVTKKCPEMVRAAK
jgi:hypothetical protein